MSTEVTKQSSFSTFYLQGVAASKQSSFATFYSPDLQITKQSVYVTFYPKSQNKRRRCPLIVN